VSDLPADIVSLLREARDIIAEERDVLLEGHCLRGNDGLPDRATLDDEDAAEVVAHMDDVIARIDAVAPPTTDT